MTIKIAFLLAVLFVMVVLFLTEKLPIDLTAFLGLMVLVFFGYVRPEDAFQGFASSAVITMLAIFVIGAALLRTGVADMVGARIHRIVGSREIPLIVTVMLAAGVLSAFMNNIAATAVLMPAVASLGRKAGLSPSRLFIPLSFGAILGGTTTLVGTPPNILAGAMLEERNMEPFALFDFTPVGASLLIVGVLFMVTIGRRLLPDRQVGQTDSDNLADLYQLQDNLFSLRIPKGSRLDGELLSSTGIRSTLGVQVVSIERGDESLVAPRGETRLQAGDQLLVQGKIEDLHDVLSVHQVDVVDPETRDLKPPEGVSAIRARLPEGSWFVGKTLKESEFRERFGVVVVGIERGGTLFRHKVGAVRLEGDDVVLGMGTERNIRAVASLPDLDILETGMDALRHLGEQRLFVLKVAGGSPLAGATIAKSRVGELMGLVIVAVVRGEQSPVAARPELVLREGDRLLVTGERSRVRGLVALGDARLESEVENPAFVSDDVGVAEATVSPRASIAGKSLEEVRFRERYGLQVLGIWREGVPVREELARRKLRVGDGLLLQGPYDRLEQLSEDDDFVTLTELAKTGLRPKKAKWALLGLALMVGLVIGGFQPIQVAAFAGATLVILAGALRMEEVYRAIEWRAIFLVAAVLPVGSAMESSGAASLLSSGVVDLAGPLGPYAVLASLIVLSSLLSQGLDGAPAVVLLTPVVLQAAADLNISPYPLMMGVSLAASAAFMTPFSHKANLLVMGLGGYKSMDYLRVGTPLTIVLIVLMVFLVPVFFPFS